MTTIILSVDPGLTLRPWRDEDLPSLLAAHRDPAMKRWLASRIEDPEQGRAWLAAQEAGWADGTRCSFAVVEAGNPSPIGHVVAKRLRPGAASAEIGYWVSVEARGRGIAPSAVSAVAEWALRRVARLQLLHDVGNHASCRVAEKTGFALESVLPPHPPRYPDEAHVHVRTAAI
ncbi:GNAT family N-acetyltransferase [Streptacidiphilus carbonis]|uniref:GNAT family N-acetyltransferase n=1 Tax=Streptacidiphilus carbonis TaxID=105422 RepID=UPI0005AB6F82|nr:GNAT family N-acetyltransferase [Streptacidiphilus carbonis]